MVLRVFALFNALFLGVFASSVHSRVVPVTDDALHHGGSASSLDTALERTGFYPSETVVLPNGKVKVKHQQYFNGVPVRKGRAVSDFSNQTFSNARGQMVSSLAASTLNVQPSLSQKRALQLLKNQHLLAPPAKELLTPENELAELFVWLDEHGSPRLVYEVSFFLPGRKPTRPHAYIDAKTGEILKTWEGLAHAEAVGQGPGGNEKTGAYTYGSDFSGFLINKSGATCTMETNDVKTVNLNHGTTGNTAFSYTCLDITNTNSFKSINGAYSPLNDAHFFGQLVFNMYQDWLNLAPLNFQLVMRVHYGNSYENAFWDGSAMTFGDGGNRFYPLVDVNVAAHEVSHGFTDQNSDLIYAGMSGGINESFSDIAGEAAEYYLRGSVDWQVGREIFKSSGALRYFITPSDDGRSIDHASEYESGMGVHFSSGVFNRAFYLLATSSGWDIPKAFRAFAFANKLYWAPDSDFNDGGCGVVRAADDLGYNTGQVVTAFEAVGVYPCLAATELEGNVPITGLSGGAGSETYFYFSSAANTDSATLSLSGGSGNANIYVKYNGWPTTVDYDCASSSSTNDEICDIPVQGGGEYNVLVTGQSDYSGASLVLNLVQTPPELMSVGETKSGLVATRGDALFYRFVLTEGNRDVSVNISGGTGDADLYVSNGNMPSETDYDCRPYYYGNNETCVISGEVGDEIYIMLHAYASFADVVLSVSYDGEALPPEQRADPLDLSAPISGITGNAGDAFYYSFTVLSNGSLVGSGPTSASLSTATLDSGVTITLDGGLGDADLYMRVGSAPTTDNFDCQSTSTSNSETCVLSSLTTGTYYVMVYGKQAFEDTTLSLAENSSSPSSPTNNASGGGGSTSWQWLLMLCICLGCQWQWARKQNIAK